MIKKGVPILAFIFLQVFFFVPTVSHAQVCNPACGSGQTCIYVGTTDSPDNPTECTQSLQCTGSDCTSDDIVVTGQRNPSSGGTTFASFVQEIVDIINRDVIPALFALAILFFMVGVARYVFFEQGNEESRQKARNMMIYGILGLVVLFGLWGLVNFGVSLLSSLGGVSSTQSSV